MKDIMLAYTQCTLPILSAFALNNIYLYHENVTQPRLNIIAIVSHVTLKIIRGLRIKTK